MDIHLDPENHYADGAECLIVLYALRVRTSEFGDNPKALKLMAERALSFSTSGTGGNDADDAYASFND